MMHHWHPLPKTDVTVHVYRDTKHRDGAHISSLNIADRSLINKFPNRCKACKACKVPCQHPIQMCKLLLTKGIYGCKDAVSGWVTMAMLPKISNG